MLEFWQDLSQLRRVYPLDWQNLVNNCGAQQYFGLSMPQAAAEIEAYLGGATPRPLSQLADDEAVLLRRSHRAQVVTRPNYLGDPCFAGQFAPNPFYSPDDDEPDEALRTVPAPDNVVRFPDGAGR